MLYLRITKNCFNQKIPIQWLEVASEFEKIKK